MAQPLTFAAAPDAPPVRLDTGARRVAVSLPPGDGDTAAATVEGPGGVGVRVELIGASVYPFDLAVFEGSCTGEPAPAAELTVYSGRGLLLEIMGGSSAGWTLTARAPARTEIELRVIPLAPCGDPLSLRLGPAAG